MQVLFVVLMTVLIGASALPNVFVKSKPSYSQRKQSSFSLVSVPKVEAKAPVTEKNLDVVNEVMEKIETASDQLSSEAAARKEASLAEEASSEKTEDSSASFSSTEGLDRDLASYVGPAGAMMIDEADLKTCVCQGDKFMQCKLYVEGSCSEVDEFVSVIARNPASNEFRKKLRCKTGNRFAGFIPVYGDQTLRMVVTFRDKLYKKDFSLTNHCGSFKAIPAFEED